MSRALAARVTHISTIVLTRAEMLQAHHNVWRLLSIIPKPPTMSAADGDLVSPVLPPGVTCRFFYEGGTVAQGRLCSVPTSMSGEYVLGLDVLRALDGEGVDLTRFFACCYESKESGGGWLPLLRDGVSTVHADNDVLLPVPTASSAPRIDVKLVRRHVTTRDAALADAAASPTSMLPSKGHFSIGIVQAKSKDNVGTLWRSAYQLGASFIFTIAKRYRETSTSGRAGDTLDAALRIPLFELDDWTSFAAHCSPKDAEWVAVEMSGVPLDEFEHPKQAVYLLGAEDMGVPASILQDCQHVVSLSSERYASYNVATAGAIIMYDRLAKSRAQEKAAAKRGGGEEAERKRKLKSLSKGNFPGRTRKGI